MIESGFDVEVVFLAVDEAPAPAGAATTTASTPRLMLRRASVRTAEREGRRCTGASVGPPWAWAHRGIRRSRCRAPSGHGNRGANPACVTSMRYARGSQRATATVAVRSRWPLPGPSCELMVVTVTVAPREHVVDPDEGRQQGQALGPREVKGLPPRRGGVRETGREDGPEAPVPPGGIEVAHHQERPGVNLLQRGVDAVELEVPVVPPRRDRRGGVHDPEGQDAGRETAGRIGSCRRARSHRTPSRGPVGTDWR